MEVKENNRLIAEFIKWMPQKAWMGVKGYQLSEPKFHESWDWLMPVVERIQTILIEYDDEYCIEFYKDHLTGKPLTYVSINWRGIKVEDENPLVANYKAVVEFIKWYNNEFKTD